MHIEVTVEDIRKIPCWPSKRQKRPAATALSWMCSSPKDGEVVIIHDERVDRTTDGTGWVRDFTLEELKKLNAAAVWNGK